MERKQEKSWPEIVLSSPIGKVSQAITRAVKKGELRKIAPKIYTSNFSDDPETIVKRHRYQILGHLYPGAVISHRSALEGGILKDGGIILTYKYSKKIDLPALTIHLVEGPGPDEGDTPFLDQLYIASRGRAFLENTSPAVNAEALARPYPKKRLKSGWIE